MATTEVNQLLCPLNSKLTVEMIMVFTSSPPMFQSNYSLEYIW